MKLVGGLVPRKHDSPWLTEQLSQLLWTPRYHSRSNVEVIPLPSRFLNCFHHFCKNHSQSLLAKLNVRLIWTSLSSQSLSHPRFNQTGPFTIFCKNVNVNIILHKLFERFKQNHCNVPMLFLNKDSWLLLPYTVKWLMSLMSPTLHKN